MRPPTTRQTAAARTWALAALLSLSGLLSAQAAPCEAGAYGTVGQSIAVLAPKPWIPPPGLGYLLLDGRYGSTTSPTSPVQCAHGRVRAQAPGETRVVLAQRSFKRTALRFTVAGAELAGELLEPLERGAPSQRPLVVMVHGSETEPAIHNTRALMLAAQGIAVFTYDKRGTGQSGGFYTQNFELLADDAAAAMQQAQALAAGRFSKAGYWGQSQGGWVAPLAATRSRADFVVVSFGLISSPIAEDRDQMLLEAERLKLGPRERDWIAQLSRATAVLVSSHFSTGFEALESIRQAIGHEAWAHSLKGEYSGDMLRMQDRDLRRVGRAVFDNLELIWDYDAEHTLKQLSLPMLWIVAGQDREAPAQASLASLAKSQAQGKPFEVYVFPDTDHGMNEFLELPDGSRRNTRVTDGYFRLLGDWILGRLAPPYGRSQVWR